MTPEEARALLRRLAGVKHREIPVVIVDGASHGPRLRRLTRRARHGFHGKEREVAVSAYWLRTKRPELWAVFVGARLLGAPALTGTITGRHVHVAITDDINLQNIERSPK